jgi:putative transposase
MLLVEQRAPEVPVDAACLALNVSRASLYRSRRPETPPASTVPRVRAPSRVASTMTSASTSSTRFTSPSLPTSHRRKSTRRYSGVASTWRPSVRCTAYRVLAEAGENKDRRNQRAPQQHAMPSLTATAPNQVWTWDITKLATLEKGVFLMAYVIIDLFSRFVVGWMAAAKEGALVRVLAEYELSSIQVHAIYRDDLRGNARIAAFLAHAREAMALPATS